MNYIPGRVYRHKSRVAKRYIRRQRIDELLFGIVSIASVVAFLVLFAGWWIA